MVHNYLYNAGYKKWITKKKESNPVPGKLLCRRKRKIAMFLASDTTIY